MYLTPVQTLLTILAIAAGTMLTRFTAFFVFPENKPVPVYVNYLGKVLPPAMIGLLVVFCFKSVDFSAMPFGIPELAATAVTLALHFWRKNVLLSICGGTAVYMLLIHTIMQ